MRCCEDPDSQVQPLAIWADSDYDDSIRTPCYSSSHGTLQTVGTLVSLAQRIASCRPILSRSLEDNFPKLSPSWQKPLTARFPWQGVLNKKIVPSWKKQESGSLPEDVYFHWRWWGEKGLVFYGKSRSKSTWDILYNRRPFKLETIQTFNK